jgi:hypothetical protein
VWTRTETRMDEVDEVRDKLCRVDELRDKTMVVCKRSETRLCLCG